MDHLDALRGIAVLGVVMVHSAMVNNRLLPLPHRVAWVAGSGQRGVALFFVVSAFTLFLSHDNRKGERRPILNFFIRRFFRLAPMFYVAIAISRFFLPQVTGPPSHILLAILFLNGLHPFTINHGAAGGWSVADEALFYACLPFLFARIKSLKAALIWALVGATVGHFVAHRLGWKYPQYGDFFTFFSFSASLPIFLLGILGYFIWKDLIVGSRMPETARRTISALLLVLALVSYFTLLPFNYETLYQESMVGLFLLLSLSLHSWSILVNPATRILGKISFSVYLLHFVVFFAVKAWIARSVGIHPFLSSPMVQFAGCFAVTLAVTLPLAYLTWRWIEEPGIRAGRRLIARLESKENMAAV